MNKLINTGNMGEETETVFWDATDLDVDTPVEEVRTFWNAPRNFPVFADGLSQRLAEKCGTTDIGEQLQWLKTKNAEKGTGIHEKTLGLWLKGKGDLHGKENSRENMFKLCFLLEYDFIQTADFFKRVYLARPFNYRSINEYVYAYCMLHSLGYSEAADIIARVSDKAEVSGKSMEASHKSTVSLRKEISAISSKQDLIQYLLENYHEFTVNSNTAQKIVSRLSDECYQLIRSSDEPESPDDHTHVQIILQEVLGYRLLHLAEKKIITIKRDSYFPDAVKNNFPSRKTYSDILKEKENRSFETIRKLIILLHFYCYWKRNTGADDSFTAYQDEINCLLDSAGYSEMYFRNPYDGLFLYAAVTDDPVYTFQDVFQSMFPCDEDTK